MKDAQTWAQLIASQLANVDNADSVLSSLLRHLPMFVCVTDSEELVQLCSAQCLKLRTRNIQNVDGLSVAELFPVDVAAQLQSLKEQDIEQPIWEEIVLNIEGGAKRVCEFCKLKIGKGNKYQLLILGHYAFEDHHIHSSLRDYKIQSHHLSFNDAVTGLANRTLFYDRLDQVFYSARRNNNHFALLLIDLDHFREFIQRHGGDIGDRYLKNIASQMIEVVREVDTVARIGGDKFVVIIDNINEAENIQNIAEKLLEAASTKMLIDDSGSPIEVHCTASIGISLYPKDGESPDQLLRQADAAVSRAKAEGKNQHQFYIKAMTESAVNYLLLENDLKKAIENDELKLYFQPQIDLRSGAICGLEVLCRWLHPERGLLQPGYFIPLAEETGLIEALGEWVLRESVRLFNHWMALGYDFGRISVNVSARQFRNPSFVELIRDVLSDSALPEFRLELELTESATMENAAQAVENLHLLKSAGVAIALDDFGTGYSSLSYIQRFPIERLKIDKAFVNDVDVSESSAATAKSIIDLANNMSLDIVAEGIERQGQANWLMARGCYIVQGDLFSKALSEDELTALANDPTRTKREKESVHFLM